jgi:elongation factor G
MLTDIRRLRNVAVVGHTGTGKTTLTEQLLFHGKVIPKAEKVETGRTVSDHTDEEIRRGISIHTTLSHVLWQDTKINVFDTPGSGDFSGEVIAAFRASESALLVVGARSGVQIETLKLWRFLGDHNMPRMVFINKVDKASSDFWQTLDDLRDKFPVPFLPVTIPLGHDQDHRGVISLLDMKAYKFSATGNPEAAFEIPSEFLDEAKKARVALIESAAEGDEELLEKFAAADTLETDDIKKGLREGLEKNQFVPVFCGSALLGSGLVPLLDFISWDAPTPFKVVEPCVTGEKERLISHEGRFSGLIFKTTIDQFAGRLNYVKVVTGKLVHNSETYVPRLSKTVRIGKLYLAIGKKLVETDELDAGDVGIIAKIDDLRTSDTLCPSDDIIHYLPLELPRPVHSTTIAAKVQKDEDKMTQILAREAEQDPTFTVSFQHDTKETILSALGELQLSIILDKLRDAKLDFLTKPPRISYRETITKPGEAEYTHKKQTGGHGQYAKVIMDFKPLPRATGFEFTSTLKGQGVSKGYFVAIEKGVQEAMQDGFLAGYPMVDLAANIQDGKEHPVDSSELAFKLAARGAFREAMATARPILLEPVMNLSVFIEEKYLGDILADLSGRRGKVLGQEMYGKDIVMVKAQVPQAEILQYALQLKALTSSTGAFEADFDHYSPLGTKETDALIKEYQAHRKAGEHDL